ncbi:hypothetical protein BPNPMPFG_007821 (plasmid) [Mesorhizobium sp. AR07]|uniref:hypothetical protein n=1 Tax=Mesorhizobium sp. AR07 TaxID=2865838 RepID=UPI00215EEE8C|nr:hypothetical protein [Mesorhizobium sp. AR07]UVK48596.1 hypothetical protein BPNPMPFG_007821 [Mesorhizobium sp. AR07]
MTGGGELASEQYGGHGLADPAFGRGHCDLHRALFRHYFFPMLRHLGVKAHRRFGAKVTFLHYAYAPMQQSAKAHKCLCDNMNLRIGAMSRDAEAAREQHISESV